MKNKVIATLILLFAIFLIYSNSVLATDSTTENDLLESAYFEPKSNNYVNFEHIINLNPGWNLVSTPRILESYEFSAPENIENFSIYLYSNTSSSGWQTMVEAGQNTFSPLYGYFIYNHTGLNQTLKFIYKQNNDPAARLFNRNLITGWNVFGVANPTYLLKQYTPDNVDTNNIQNTLASISSSVVSLLDLTHGNEDLGNIAVTDNWKQVVFSQAYELNDFRETKAYIAYLDSSATYTGFQNDDEIATTSIYEISNPPNSEISASSSLLLSGYTDLFPSYTLAGQGGQLGVQSIYFDARNGTSTITELSMTIDESASSSVSVAQLTEIWSNDVIGYAPLIGNSFVFSDIKFVIPKNQGKSFAISYFVKPIEVNTDVNGINFKNTVTGYKATTFDGYSLTEKDENNFVPISGSSRYLLKSVPRLGPINTETPLSVGNKKIFKFYAGNNENYFTEVLTSWKKITFNVKKSPNLIFGASTTIKIFDNNSTVIPGTAYYEGTDLRAEGAVNNGKIIFIADEEQFFKYAEYNLVAELGGYLTSGDYLSVGLVSDSDWENSSSFNQVNGNFAWSDLSAIPHSEASSDWYNGYFSDVNTTMHTMIYYDRYGELNINLSNGTPESSVLPATFSETEIARFNFSAINDDIVLTKITFANASTTAPQTDTDSMIAAVHLYDGVKEIGFSQFINGAGEFNLYYKIIIPANETKMLTVTVRLNQVDNTEYFDKKIQFVLDTVEFRTSSGLFFEQKKDIAAAYFIIRKTMPAIVAPTLPGNILLIGNQIISRFIVAADSAGSVALARFEIDYATTTDVNFTGLENGLKINGKIKNISSVINKEDKKIIITFDSPEIIEAGQQKTFDVMVSIDSAPISSSAIVTNINRDYDYNIGSLASSVQGNFIWSDSVGYSDYIYTNGYLLPWLPTLSQVLVN